MKKIIIIGGGIIGLSSAYYLLKEGYTVTVIDQYDISSGASFVNAGYVSPSHVIPLAAPGMISMGIKMMFNAASPFYLKPRINLDLWKWAWAFNKSCTIENVKRGAPVIKDIAVFSRTLFEEMKENKVFDFHFEKKGILMCYQSAKFEDKEAYLAEVATEQGLEVKHISKDKLKEMEPEMEANGAYHYLCDAHTIPDDFMLEFKNYLTKQGVKFYLNQPVLGFDKKGTKIKNVKIENKNIDCDEIVIAAGSWSPALVKMLEINLLVQAGKGYRINVARETNIKYPSILTDVNTAVTPMNGFTRFGGTMEIVGISSHINKIRVHQIAKNAKIFYPNVNINRAEMENAACGLRPVSPDGLPFIGRTKKYSNVCIATGHAMMGWTMGPATGKLISEIVSEKQSTLNLEPFSVDRKY
ncbi:FAD-binding oxidoreductase [Lutibacter sp.]|uniref:NAD(P)/FAD-dependent oxidoreductase n=1 Tax=Lutibacter sp. TaxID=1925666 RepID=UPI002732FCD5|nr:FAD-dependent oxidoreductase [Lutibacter sp.]MDP3313277.1 FAD-dependent oxidoreductase [Lutibacter sp.]